MKNADGFSLPEILICVAMLGVVSLAVAAMMRTGHLGLNTVYQNQETVHLVDLIETAMAHPSTCTVNLAGHRLRSADPGGFSINDGLYPPSPQDLPDLVKDRSNPIVEVLTGSRTLSSEEIYDDPIQVLSIQVLPIAVVSVQSVVGEIVLSLESQKRALGSKDAIRRFPFLANVDDSNRIISCASLSADGPAFYNSMCELTSNDRMYYDEVEKKCVSKYDLFWQEGTRDSATCPQHSTRVSIDEMDHHTVETIGAEADWDMKVCSTGNVDADNGALKDELKPGSATGDFLRLVRNYPGLGMEGGKLAPDYKALESGLNSCQCYYAEDSTSTGSRCAVYCERLKPQFR